MSSERSGGARRLGDLSTEALAKLLASEKCVALLPVGSVEPHGPHLPLSTDTIISEAAIDRAAPALAAKGLCAIVAPAVPYGVTLYAAGFAGAISVEAAALTAFLRSVAASLLGAGFAHVCLVNNHLEPAHDEAVRAAVRGFEEGRASVACPLTRRWARTLSAEFKSGACHAGRYETSLVLAARAELVDEAAARSLPPLAISLSEGIQGGKATFREMGIDRAYTGTPNEASRGEGDDLLDRLAEMVVHEVTEAIARLK